MKGRFGLGLALGLLLALLATGLAWAQKSTEPDIKVAYLERPPYYWTDNGHPRGFLLELTQRIFNLAGIKATYAPAPPNRIIADLRENREPICSIGWFRNPERESYSRFSLPIYRDRPLVILTNQGPGRKLQAARPPAGCLWRPVPCFGAGRIIFLW